MRLIDTDKLHIDKQINGECWINQEQIINALTVEAVPLSVIEKIKAEIEERSFTYFAYQTTLFAVSLEDVLEIIDKAVKECTHE